MKLKPLIEWHNNFYRAKKKMYLKEETGSQSTIILKNTFEFQV